LLVRQLGGNFREIGLRVRDSHVFGLRAVDGVSEAPAAGRLVAFAVAALRQKPGQAGVALPARRDRPDQDAVADGIADNAGANFLDHPDRLVADDAAGSDRILAAHDMQVGAADRRQCNSNDRVTRAGARPLDLFDSESVLGAKYVGLHLILVATQV
jgi:hypothetical protein